jgi:hypothetical protein
VCHVGWTNANCTARLLCRYWDEEEETWSSKGMVAAPPPSGVPDGFLHCESTHLTDFGGVVKIPLSAEELIDELRGIKFNFFTLDELAGALSSFSVADNPAIFTVITLSTAIDVAFIFFTHWRWRRRRLAGSRRRAVGKKAKRDEAELAAIFSAFDADGSGKIDADEMVEALARAGKPMERDEVEKIVKTVDKNNDGEIDLDEFKAIFKLSPEMLPARLQELVEAGDVLGAAQAGYQPKNWKESLRLKVHAHLAAQKELAEAGLQNPDAEKMDAAQKAMAMAIGRMQTMARRTQTLAQMSYEERTRASQAVQKGVRRWKARAQAQLEAKELARQRAVRGSSWVPSQAVFGPLPGLTDKSTTSGLMYGARPVDPRWEVARKRFREEKWDQQNPITALVAAAPKPAAAATALPPSTPPRSPSHIRLGVSPSLSRIASRVAPEPPPTQPEPLSTPPRRQPSLEYCGGSRASSCSGESPLAAVETTTTCQLIPSPARSSSRRRQGPRASPSTDPSSHGSASGSNLIARFSESSPSRPSKASTGAVAFIQRSPPPSPPSGPPPAHDLAATPSRLLRPTQASRARASEGHERQASLRATAALVAHQRALARQAAQMAARVQAAQPSHRPPSAASSAAHSATGNTRSQRSSRSHAGSARPVGAEALLNSALGQHGLSLARVDRILSGRGEEDEAAELGDAEGSEGTIAEESEPSIVVAQPMGWRQSLPQPAIVGRGGASRRAPAELIEKTRDTVSSVTTQESDGGVDEESDGGASKALPAIAATPSPSLVPHPGAAEVKRRAPAGRAPARAPAGAPAGALARGPVKWAVADADELTRLRSIKQQADLARANAKAQKEREAKPAAEAAAKAEAARKAAEEKEQKAAEAAAAAALIVPRPRGWAALREIRARSEEAKHAAERQQPIRRANSIISSWSQGAKAGARARLSEQISDNRQRLAERRRELMEQVEAKRRALSEVNAKEAAIKSLALARTFRNEFIRTMQSEHTIVAAVAPNTEDTAGDHLRDENVVHIFFLTVMSELCVLCLLRGGASVPVFSITTVINGLITTGSCGAFAIAAKRIFRFGNKLRWRRKDRTREDAAKLIQRRFRRRKMLRKRKKGLRGCCHRFLKRLRKLRRRLRRRLVRLLCFWRRDAKDGKYRVRAKGKAKAAKGSSKAGRKGRAPPRPSLKEMLARAAAEDAGRPGEGGVVKIGSFADLVKAKQREEHALFGRFPLTAPNALQGRAASRWITMHPRLHLFRFWLAWTINLGLYAAACVVCLAYGVLFSAPAFTELLVAWLLALGFTWAVVEPSEVLGIVLLPALSKNARVMACRAWCKDLGFF